jgi:hypothetical protein
MPNFIKEMPLDPFSKTGGFTYKNEKGKIYLYSVGKNSADDSAKQDDIAVITPTISEDKEPEEIK